MYRFSKRAGLLLTLLTLVLSGLYWISETVAPVYPASKKRVALFKKAAPEVEAITLRNSHSRAIYFDAMGVKGFHLFLGGTDIFESEYVLRNTRARLDSLEYVLIPVYSLAFDNTLVSRPERRREVYTRYAWGLDYLPGDRKLFLQSRALPVVRPDHWEEILWPASLHVSEKKDSVSANGFIYNRPRTGNPRPDSINSSAVRRAKHHLAFQKQSLAKRPGLCEDAIKTFGDIAELAGPEATLVLYRPPLPEVYENTYKRLVEADTGCPQLWSRMKTFARRRDGVALFNFSSVLPTEDRQAYFLDGDHLNLRGARLMSAALGDSLRALSSSQ